MELLGPTLADRHVDHPFWSFTDRGAIAKSAAYSIPELS
jgi:hypothetical protein